jgi:HEAT repeat protein
VRADVVAALGDRRYERAVPPILRRLETEQDSFVRETILAALRRLEA